MSALASRLLQEYGVTRRRTMHVSPMVRVSEQRSDTSSVWEVTDARRILVSVEDVLWTNIIASQCIPRGGLLSKVESDYEHLWALAEITPQRAAEFLCDEQGVNWATGATFRLSDPQLAMLVVLADGVPVDAVDVEASYGGGKRVRRHAVLGRDVRAPPRPLRTACWVYSTMGSGKSIVAWFAARRVVSDRGWEECRGTEREWSASNLNGDPEAPEVSTRSASAADQFPGVEGLVKRVVVVVCPSFLVGQWREVVSTNSAPGEFRLHSFSSLSGKGRRVVFHLQDSAPHTHPEVRSFIACASQPGKAVIVCTQSVLSAVTACCPLRLACVVFDELGSMRGSSPMAYRTLLLSATPGAIFSGASDLGDTMRETLFGSSVWQAAGVGQKRVADARVAAAWARFARMNPMPGVQIDNSTQAMLKMPLYMEIENYDVAQPSMVTRRFEMLCVKHDSRLLESVFSHNLHDRPGGAEVCFVPVADAPALRLSDVVAFAEGAAADLRHLLAAYADDGAWAATGGEGSRAARTLAVPSPRFISGVSFLRGYGRDEWASREKTWVEETLSEATALAAKTHATCCLCAGGAPASSLAVSKCCTSLFCDACMATDPIQAHSCSFCFGHVIRGFVNDGGADAMSTAAGALVRMLGDGEGRTKVLLVVPNVPSNFIRRFVRLVEAGTGAPEGSVRVHTAWDVATAKACAASPERVDILFHGSDNVAGMDMGILDCIVTIGLVPNKQQLYSRALRTGTRRREKLKVAQVAKKSTNVWRFFPQKFTGWTKGFEPPRSVELLAEAVAALHERVLPVVPAHGDHALVSGDGAVRGFLAECLNAFDDGGGGGAYDASVVDRVVVAYVKPRTGPRVSYEEIEAVSTPRIRHINGGPTRMDIEFDSAVRCEFIPPAADAIIVSLESSGWTAQWISTTEAAPQPAGGATGVGKTIRIRFYTSKEGALKVFELDDITHS